MTSDEFKNFLHRMLMGSVAFPTELRVNLNMPSLSKLIASDASETVATTKESSSMSETAKAFDGIDVPIHHAGNGITLPLEPAKMDLKTAIITLQRKEESAEQVSRVYEKIEGFFADGLIAFMKAMQQTYGWVEPVPTRGFFSSTPPATISIRTGLTERATAIWGRFELPGVEGFLETGRDSENGMPFFAIYGQVKRKFLTQIQALATLTRQIAKEQSIYRGKAVSIAVDDDGDVVWGEEGFAFMDLAGAHAEDLIFATSTERQIQTSLWTPIERTALCRTHKIPLKRGVLLSGKYGTGKTMTAAVTAAKCVENGWTFLMISRVSGLDQALLLARQLQPCVVFAEDIDRVVEGEERNEDIDDVLNTIDGVEAKGTEILVVLTTNHIEKINRAMLRPGRLDAVIEVEPPDGDAVRRLVRIYGRGLVAPGDQLAQSGEVLAGQIPAVIRECVERAKLVAIGHASEGELTITDSDVATAAQGMLSHIELLTASNKEEKDPDAFSSLIRGAVNDVMSKTDIAELPGELRRLRDQVGAIRQRVGA